MLSCKTFELCADVSVPQAQILSELSLIPESQMNTLGLQRMAKCRGRSSVSAAIREPSDPGFNIQLAVALK